MKTLLKPSNNFKLDESLDDLHAQSMEWLSDIAFWKDENAFLVDLLEMHKSRALSSNHHYQQLVNFRKNLIDFESRILEDLNLIVLEHEHKLSVIMENEYSDIVDYRTKHKMISEKVKGVYKSMKELKRNLFSFVKALK